MTTRYNIIRQIINRGGEFPLSQKRKFRDMFKNITDGIEVALGLASKSVLQNQLLEGTVTWIEGLTFTISDCVFVLDEVVYEATGQTITLSDADATHPRIDVFYADIDGTTGVLEGTPAADPVKPSVDPSSQVELSFALIAATATEPTGVSNAIIYDEDDNWTTAVSADTIEKAATTDPHAGTKHIQFTDARRNQYISLTNAATISTASYDKLIMYVKASNIGTGRRSGFRIEFYQGNSRVGSITVRNGNYGILNGNDNYVLLAIPTSDMNFSEFSAMRIVANADNVTFAIDDISLQSGQGNTSGGAYAYTNVSNPWSAAQASPVIQLTDAATIDVDLSRGNVFEVTLGDNRTIDFRNALTGQHFTMIVKQDGTGSRTLTWDADNDWAGGTAPTLSTGANAVDVLTFMVDSSGNIHGTLGIAASA